MLLKCCKIQVWKDVPMKTNLNALEQLVFKRDSHTQKDKLKIRQTKRLE